MRFERFIATLIAFASTVVVNVFVAAADDLGEYIAARRKWNNDRFAMSEPEFDRKLCVARLLEGFRRGVLVALGAGVVTAVATGGN